MTGPLLTIQSVSSVAFLVAVVALFVSRRIAAAVAIVGCVLAVPLYLYLVVPGLFRNASSESHSRPLTLDMVWDPWAAAGLAGAAMSMYVSTRALCHEGSSVD